MMRHGKTATKAEKEERSTHSDPAREGFARERYTRVDARHNLGVLPTSIERTRHMENVCMLAEAYEIRAMIT